MNFLEIVTALGAIIGAVVGSITLYYVYREYANSTSKVFGKSGRRNEKSGYDGRRPGQKDTSKDINSAPPGQTSQVGPTGAPSVTQAAHSPAVQASAPTVPGVTAAMATPNPHSPDISAATTNSLSGPAPVHHDIPHHIQSAVQPQLAPVQYGSAPSGSSAPVQNVPTAQVSDQNAHNAAHSQNNSHGQNLNPTNDVNSTGAHAAGINVNIPSVSSSTQIPHGAGANIQQDSADSAHISTAQNQQHHTLQAGQQPVVSGLDSATQGFASFPVDHHQTNSTVQDPSVINASAAQGNTATASGVHQVPGMKDSVQQETSAQPSRDQNTFLQVPNLSNVHQNSSQSTGGDIARASSNIDSQTPNLTHPQEQNIQQNSRASSSVNPTGVSNVGTNLNEKASHSHQDQTAGVIQHPSAQTQEASAQMQNMSSQTLDASGAGDAHLSSPHVVNSGPPLSGALFNENMVNNSAGIANPVTNAQASHNPVEVSQSQNFSNFPEVNPQYVAPVQQNLQAGQMASAQPVAMTAQGGVPAGVATQSSVPDQSLAQARVSQQTGPLPGENVNQIAIEVISNNQFLVKNTGVHTLYDVKVISNTMWLDGQTSVPVLSRDQMATVNFFPFAGRFIKISFYNGEKFIVEEREIPFLSGV